MDLTRRAALQLATGACASLASGWGVAWAAGDIFGIETVIAKARDLAGKPYVGPGDALPESLAGLSYDDFRRINFRTDRTLLRDGGSNFGLQLFHRGSIFKHQAKVNLVADGVATPLLYSPDLFDFGDKGAPQGLPTSLGFAGIRLLYPLNHSGKLDELAAFLGASYFRFLGKGQNYGLSARGLSLGSGGAHEEFPDFVEFWVETPQTGQGSIAVHALLDGPSVTGAYRFTFEPGTGDDVQVQATLFARKDLAEMGLAPLTSMFLYGENTLNRPHDFRPEVHDSDGLAIQSEGGEWLWRPLRNPTRNSVSNFYSKDIKGFGLIQRDRAFSSYQDLEALYDKRPGYWVEMKNRLGQGRVVLVELHSGSETDDNIVASWVPDVQPKAGSETQIAYVIHAVSDPLHQGGQAYATFETHNAAATSAGKPNVTRFLIDFVGGRLKDVSLDVSKIELVIWGSKGTVSAPSVVANPAINGVRASFDAEPPPGEDIDLRAFLRMGTETLTETWTYRLDAAEPV
ncbi:glucan biosynthesis protein [Labrys neptuniae]